MTEISATVGEYMREVVSGVRPAVEAVADSSYPVEDSGPRMSNRAHVQHAHLVYRATENDCGAWVAIDFDAAQRRAEVLDSAERVGDASGALAGWTVGIKDIIDVRGFPTAHGSKVPASVQGHDAWSVAELRRQGAILLGKTHTHEYAYGLTTPQTSNARDHNRIAGGSSGGSAVAVATGVADAALETDTGGSTRVPASLNGVVGFKPTYNRLSLDGATSLSPTLDHLGILADSVSKVRAIFDVLDQKRACHGGPGPEAFERSHRGQS